MPADAADDDVPRSPRAAVAVLAGGSGTRLGAGVNKVYLPLAGRAVLGWSVRTVAQVPSVRHLVLVVRAGDEDAGRQVLDAERDALTAAGIEVAVVHGGASRHASEDAALAHLEPLVRRGEVDVIAVHDGARPLAGPHLFAAVIDAAARYGGALPAVPVTAALTRDLAEPVGPDVVRVQTPQAFRALPLLAAYAAAGAAGFEGSDTASSVEVHGDVPVHVVPGSATNLKITFSHDLVVAEGLLSGEAIRSAAGAQDGPGEGGGVGVVDGHRVGDDLDLQHPSGRGQGR